MAEIKSGTYTYSYSRLQRLRAPSLPAHRNHVRLIKEQWCELYSHFIGKMVICGGWGNLYNYATCWPKNMIKNYATVRHLKTKPSRLKQCANNMCQRAQCLFLTCIRIVPFVRVREFYGGVMVPGCLNFPHNVMFDLFLSILFLCI